MKSRITFGKFVVVSPHAQNNITKIVDCFFIAMYNLPNMQDQVVKDLSQMKKGHPKSVEFVMPAFELLVDT
jgi:hypothetical protein